MQRIHSCKHAGTHCHFQKLCSYGKVLNGNQFSKHSHDQSSLCCSVSRSQVPAAAVLYWSLSSWHTRRAGCLTIREHRTNIMAFLLCSQVAFDANILIGMAKMLQTVPSETTDGLPVKEAHQFLQVSSLLSGQRHSRWSMAIWWSPLRSR